MRVVFRSFLTCAAVAVAVAADFDTGVKLLNEGRFAEAEKHLAAAYKKTPSDYTVACEYARVAPCSVAIAIFSQCATDPKAPDSLRAVSYRQLGDYSFVHSAFKTAAERYRLAAKLLSTPEYRHRWALASAALHDTKTARSLWHTITLDHGTDLASEAHYHLGMIDMEEQHYDSAMVRFGRAGKLDAAKSWTVAATAAKLECAIRLGLKDSVTILEKRLQPFDRQLLEKDLIKLASLPPAEQSVDVLPAGSRQTPPDAAGSDGPEYTLQVGAFGSLDNAEALRGRLSSRFGQVAVVPVTLSEQIFYRVRIGTFSTREAAEAYGTDSLAPAGITFKAVVK